MASSPENKQTGQSEVRTEQDKGKDNEDIDEVEEAEEEEEEEEEGEEKDEEEYDDEDEEPATPDRPRMRSDVENARTLFLRLQTEQVPIRVHDVIIKGNSRTKEYVIEAQIQALKTATTVQELIQAAGEAKERLRELDVFDSVNITLDAGPPELPGTANVVVEIAEAKNLSSGDMGIYSRPEARSWSAEGSVKLKNLFGYMDLWDCSLAYGWDQTSEISVGVALPRFKGLITPITARVSLLSQDWLKFSSYNERALGLSLGLLSSRNHNLSYNLSWRTLSDPSQLSSRTVRRQLGHSLLSAVKYGFRIDRRNSSMRPTKGYAFLSTSQLGGIFPDYRSLHFFRQEFDFRCAFPLGFLNAALNFGVSGGMTFPWGSGFLNMPSYLPERFFLGGNSSVICTMGGPLSVPGFKTRGLGPAEPRRQGRENSNDETTDSSGTDFLGGDLAVTGFADLSFDLPLKVLRDAGIHGHAFACTGSLTSLAQNAFRDLSFKKFQDSFRSSVGFGIVVPTKIFRMEVNYCHILKQQEHDQGKSGVQFNFSSPYSL